jgi:hexosaminidase
VQVGEFALWGEFIDATNLISRGFPMGCAVGERLWSAKEVTSLPDARVWLGGPTRAECWPWGLPAEPPSGPSSCSVEYSFAYAPPF